MKAIIIGCGYVGKEVAKVWKNKGFTVTVTTTNPERIPELETIADRVVVLTGTDQTSLQACLAEQHTVLVTVGSKRGANYKETYLGTAQTLATVLPHTSIQQLIYTSTYSVYGQHHGAEVTEETTATPVTQNGQIIAETEQTYLGLTGLNVCILRLGGIYGPNRELAKIYGRSAGSTRPGSGQEASNWVHRDDIVTAIAFAQTKGLRGIYNLVQDQIPTVKELIDQVCKHYSLDPISWDPTQPSARPYNARVSNQKIKAAGYQFLHPNFEF